MKVLYSSDFHGETRLYWELLELAMSISANIVIFGGDLLPSFLPANRYEHMLLNQESFIDQFLVPFSKTMLEIAGVEKILVIAGNWDVAYPYLFSVPRESLIDLNQKKYQFENGYEMIGYPFVPPTPFRPKDFEKMDDPDAPWPPQKNPSYIRSTDNFHELIPISPYFYLKGRETIQEGLLRLPEPKDERRTIYVMHSPPFGTQLDLIQGGQHAGSRSIKSFIEERQPLMTLHGHIHESPKISGAFLDTVGVTLSVNPGQSLLADSRSGKLYAIVFEMEKPGETISHTCLT